MKTIYSRGFRKFQNMNFQINTVFIHKLSSVPLVIKQRFWNLINVLPFLISSNLCLCFIPGTKGQQTTSSLPKYAFSLKKMTQTIISTQCECNYENITNVSIKKKARRKSGYVWVEEILMVQFFNLSNSIIKKY